VHEGDGKREEEIVQMGSERFIGQFPFLIFHFPFGDHTYRVSLKNGKWKMTNKSSLSVNLHSLLPLKMLPHIPNHFRNLCG